ncbi:MAG: SRPBCC family protein, partial [Thermosynechococcaceae cyanobacterium]
MMNPMQVFEQSIRINASVPIVDQTITDRDLMHQWLNPMLRCDPIGDWQTAMGSECLFVMQVPLVHPTLHSVVVERRLG